jgi:hypothetical protein
MTNTTQHFTDSRPKCRRLTIIDDELKARAVSLSVFHAGEEIYPPGSENLGHPTGRHGHEGACEKGFSHERRSSEKRSNAAARAAGASGPQLRGLFLFEKARLPP